MVTPQPKPLTAEELAKIERDVLRDPPAGVVSNAIKLINSHAIQAAQLADLQAEVERYRAALGRIVPALEGQQMLAREHRDEHMWDPDPLIRLARAALSVLTEAGE